MHRKTKKSIAFLLTLLTVMSLTACGGNVPDDYVEGKSAGKELEQTAAADDVFTLNCSKKNSMNPLVATNSNNQLVCDLVYENMVELDNNYNVIPNIITDWETENGSYWTFKVNTNRTFHNGGKLTAKDVAYSIQCACSSARFKQRLSYVYGASALDDTTVVVSLSKKNMMFPALLTIPVVKYGTNSEDHPDGTGPYAFAKDYNSLVAFDKYPNADTLPVDVIYLAEYTDTDETILAFQDSVIDVVMNDPTSSTNIGYGSANEIRVFNTTNLHYIGFNTMSDEFKYEALRFAMNFAFDRAYLVNTLLGGNGIETELMVSPACKYYDESYAKQLKYDLNKCQEILSNIGLEDVDKDGYLELKMGNAVTEIDINFVVCRANGAKMKLAEKFVEEMTSIGLKVTLNAYSWSAYKKVLDAGNYDMYYAEARINPDFDPSKFLTFGGSLNKGFFQDENLEDAIAQFLQADDENRMVACQNMCAMIANKSYVVPLCFERHQLVTHRGVIEGIKVNENNPFYNVQNWTITIKNVVEDQNESVKGES